MKVVNARVKVTVRKADGTTAILLEGHFDRHSADAVREAVYLALAQEPERVVLDLGGLSFMDAAGVGVMMEACQRAEAEDVELWIVRC